MSLVVVEKKNFIRVVKMNRVDKLNALNWDLVDELTEALSDLEKESALADIRCLILGSSTPKAFCVGADLKERAQMTDEKVLETLNKYNHIAKALDNFPAPVIAVIEGAAFGGGLELALACDMRVAAPTAQMGLVEVNLAGIPGVGGTQRLPRIVGEAKAKELIFLAEKLSGEGAATIGLVNACEKNPWEKAFAWAEEISRKGPIAIRLAKRAISDGRGLSLENALQVERSCYLGFLESNDRREGLAAFAEKREPHYKGE